MRASSAAATSSGAAVHAAAAVAAASVDRPPLNLLAELPSHTEALEQQRINLLRFVADNPAVFAEMPYEPFTHAPRRSSPLQFEIRPAGPPLCGLQGVFSLQDVPAKDKEQEAMFYSGLLIPGPSYESFCNQYYCPTGLELPALTYKDRASGANVKVLVIGDPTGLAAIINDGVFGRTGERACTGSCQRAITHGLRLNDSALFACSRFQRAPSTANSNPFARITSNPL